MFHSTVQVLIHNTSWRRVAELTGTGMDMGTPGTGGPARHLLQDLQPPAHSRTKDFPDHRFDFATFSRRAYVKEWLRGLKTPSPEILAHSVVFCFTTHKARTDLSTPLGPGKTMIYRRVEDEWRHVCQIFGPSRAGLGMTAGQTERRAPHYLALSTREGQQ
ncbi:hypothetical protein J6590_015580 [Homalodisca vitripennis]|nr:hypothetical protein J6590_015580 [Homalodisca vitripennis]